MSWSIPWKTSSSVAEKPASLKRSWQRKEGTFRALGMAKIEPILSESGSSSGRLRLHPPTSSMVVSMAHHENSNEELLLMGWRARVGVFIAMLQQSYGPLFTLKCLNIRICCSRNVNFLGPLLLVTLVSAFTWQSWLKDSRSPNSNVPWAKVTPCNLETSYKMIQESSSFIFSCAYGQRFTDCALILRNSTQSPLDGVARSELLTACLGGYKELIITRGDASCNAVYCIMILTSIVWYCLKLSVSPISNAEAELYDID